MPLSPNLRGSLLMAAAMAGFTMNDSITKLMSSEMNFGQVMLVRGLFAILLIGALAIHQGALRPLRTLFVKPVALRIVGEVGGTVAFLAAITHLPLANTSAIMQSLPLAITLGAALTLGEPVGWRRWSAIVAGFVGVLIIVRPGVAGFNQFTLLALVSVVFCSLRDLATKMIPSHIPSLFITLLTTITVTTTGAFILFPLGGWSPPSGRSVGLRSLVAVQVLIGFQWFILALRWVYSDAILTVCSSAQLWALLLGYLVFGDVPDTLMVLGASIIVASGLYDFNRERIRNREVAARASGLPPDGL